VTRRVKQHLEEIRGCFPKDKRSGTLRLTLRFHPDGKIKKVILETAAQKDQEKTLTELFQKWTWPPTRDGRPGEITVEVNLG
jgi:hypothetical protein